MLALKHVIINENQNMTTFKNEAGEDVEAMTPEEVEAAKQEAIEQYKTENPDKTDEITALQEELAKKEDLLAKASDADKNFAALRKGKEDAEKKLIDFTKDVDTKLSKMKMEVLEGVMQDHKNDMLKALSGGDAEVKKKIEYHYKRLGDVAATKEEITNKLKDAYVLATKQEAGDISGVVLGSGGVGRLNIKSNSPEFSPEEKELGARFGLTDEDLKGK